MTYTFKKTFHVYKFSRFDSLKKWEIIRSDSWLNNFERIKPKNLTSKFRCKQNAAYHQNTADTGTQA